MNAVIGAAFVLVLSSAACASQSDLPDRVTDLAGTLPDSLVLNLRIGDATGEGPTTFSTITDLAVDPKGRIFVLLALDQEVRVFDPDGRYLHTISRTGFGPGELGSPQSMMRGPDGTLWIYDANPPQFEVFASDGTFLRSIRRQPPRLPCGAVAGFDATGRVVQSIGGPLRIGEPIPCLVERLEVRNDGMEIVSSLPIPAAPTSAYWAYAARTHVAFDHRSALWIGHNREYRIARVSFSGDTLAVISREAHAIPITREGLSRAHERRNEMLGAAARAGARMLPSADGSVRSSFETKPYFSQLAVDERGRLWVALAGARDGFVDTFDVFADDGRHLGTVPVRGDLSVTSVANDRAWRAVLRFQGDHVYGTQESGDGIPRIVRFRFVYAK